MQDAWLLTFTQLLLLTFTQLLLLTFTQLSTDPSKVTMAELFHQIHEAVNDKLR